MQFIWKRVISFSLVTGFILAPIVASATNSIQATASVKSLQQISSQESQDEIYFLISVLEPKGTHPYTVPGYRRYITASHSRLPQPSVRPKQHWKITKQSPVENVSLWKHKLQSGEKALLDISLSEADLPPWNIDDTLGRVKITLTNNNGVLQTSLTPVSHTKLTKKEESANGATYDLQVSNGKAKYLVTLSISNK